MDLYWNSLLILNNKMKDLLQFFRAKMKKLLEIKDLVLDILVSLMLLLLNLTQITIMIGMILKLHSIVIFQLLPKNKIQLMKVTVLVGMTILLTTMIKWMKVIYIHLYSRLSTCRKCSKYPSMMNFNQLFTRISNSIRYLKDLKMNNTLDSLLLPVIYQVLKPSKTSN